MALGIFQNNDVEIRVTITQNGESVDIGSISSATYKIFSSDKKTELVAKTLGAGIEKEITLVAITLDQSDTVDLNQEYYHELQVVSGGKVTTAFANRIKFNEALL